MAGGGLALRICCQSNNGQFTVLLSRSNVNGCCRLEAVSDQACRSGSLNQVGAARKARMLLLLRLQREQCPVQSWLERARQQGCVAYSVHPFQLRFSAYSPTPRLRV
jgi:hypothetical protein